MSLNTAQFNSIFGGVERKTERWYSGCNCEDTYEDANDNGKHDVDECLTLTNCEE